jgi:hypothetical protein
VTHIEGSSSGRKRPPVRYSEWWFVGDRGALAAALRRENVRDGMRCGMAQAHRSGYI